MNISQIFITRPVMTTLLTLGILIFGLMSYPKLPVSDLPNVDFPVIMVQTSLPGASPETMAAAVATPLEKQFSTIAGLDTMTSTSALGVTSIILQFNLERDIDSAAQDVQSAISQTLKQLPTDLPSPPAYTKINPGDQPILYVALTSPTQPLSMLDYYAQTMISQRISTVNGVAQVQILGSKKYAVRIQLNPKLLSSWKIGIDEIQSAIQNANVNLPTGTLDGRYQSFTIQANGQLFRAEYYKQIIICYRNGAPVRLQDVAEVFDSVENTKTQSWYGKNKRLYPAIILAIQRQPGTNTVQVATAVKGMLGEIQNQLPASVKMEIMFDRSTSIKESVSDVKFTMLLTLFLVVMVIFFFLRNARATLIPSLTLPMSIIGTFIVMYLLNYSLDNLSLMALTLSIGFVVDDAIVMLENIFRHLEMGKTVRQAALDGSREISFTIISMTLSLSAVFIPVLFMGGIVGRLFQEFGVTIAVAVLVSGLVSLTLIPMLCSRFLKERMVSHADGVEHQQNNAAIVQFYGRSLRLAVRHWKMVILFSLVILLGTFGLFYIVPKGFLPNEDMGFLFGQTEGNQGVSYDAMKEHQMAGVSIIQSNPNVESFVTRVGVGGFTLTPNSGMYFLRLTPRSQRKLSADAVLQELRQKMLEIPGFKVFLMNPQPINVGGRATKSQYQYTLQGSDIAELYKYAIKTEGALGKMSGLFDDVTSDLQNSNPQLSLEINREKASLLNISATQIENALYSAFGTRKISTIYTSDNQYSVLMELKDDYKMDQEGLGLLYVRSQSGQLVPLLDLVSVTKNSGPLTINHSGQLPSVTLSFNLKPKVSLSQAVDAIEKQIQNKFPVSISAKFQGTAEAFKKSMSGMFILLIVTIMVIYIILGVLYEDYLHPITILTALPFAGFGAILSLLVCNVELSLYGFIGIIMLVGIVKKNGIMMIDFAIVARREHGKTAQDAIIEACMVRFRPIMMTTAAAIMAGIPLAIGWGAGGEARRPLGITLVGGLLFSQLLTLYVTPVFYVCVEYLRDKYHQRNKVIKDNATH